MPPCLGLAPDVAVGVDEHHEGPDRPARLEEENPSAVEEEEDGETKLHTVAHSLHVVNGVVKRLPGSLLEERTARRRGKFRFGSVFVSGKVCFRYFVFGKGINVYLVGAAAYQLGNTSSRTITEVKQR